VEGYDGVTLRFRVTEEEAKDMYMRDSPPSDEEVQHIQIMTERLVASKKETTGEEITIIKEPATETKTVQVEIAHEEAIIDKNPIGEKTLSLHPVQSIKEIKIPLMKEEIEISKQPYVKEEVVIRKKPVIETRTVTEEVKSEKVKVRRGTGEEEKEEKR
jgi:uncharacterized protein (TIGR02271 family)